MTMATGPCPACVDGRCQDCWGRNNGGELLLPGEATPYEVRPAAPNIDCLCTSFRHPKQLHTAVLSFLPAGRPLPSVDEVRAMAEQMSPGAWQHPEHIADELRRRYYEPARPVVLP